MGDLYCHAPVLTVLSITWRINHKLIIFREKNGEEVRFCFINDWKINSVKGILTHLLKVNVYCMDFLTRPGARIKNIYENAFFPLVKL